MFNPDYLAAVLLAGLALSACAATTPVAVDAVVPDVMPGDLELAVIPRPKQEKPRDSMIVVGRDTQIVAPQWEKLRAGRDHLMKLLGLDDQARVHDALRDQTGGDTLVVVAIGQPPAGAEGLIERAAHRLDDLRVLTHQEQAYALEVRYDQMRDQNLILIQALSPRGAFYAIQSLKQLAYTKDGRVHVRQTQMLDWPTFAARGSKRPGNRWTWEYELKSNFIYEGFRHEPDVAREHFAEWWIAAYIPVTDKQLDVTPQRLQQAIDWMKESHQRGASDFCIHLDDQRIELTPESHELFNGDYYAAAVHFLHEFHKAMKQTDPAARLYFLPTPYWTQAPYEQYAQKLQAAGGLPDGTALVFCGPQVTSPSIPPDNVRRYLETFRSSHPALIYDNHYRDETFQAIDARPAELAEVLIGISPERGTATTRASRLDWGWNPEGYDRERSLMLAVREFAGLENWAAVYGAVSAFTGALAGTEYQPREQAVAHYQASLERCGQLLEKLRRMDDHGLAGRLKLPDSQPSGFAYDLVDQLASGHRIMTDVEGSNVVHHAYKEMRVSRAAQAPAIDGRVDDEVWQSAPVTTIDQDNGEPKPENERSFVRFAYDAAHLYISIDMRTSKPIDFDQEVVALGGRVPSGTTTQRTDDQRGVWGLSGWHSVFMLIDPHHTHEGEFEFQLNPAGHRADGRYLVTSAEEPQGLEWDSNWTSAVTAGDGGWVAEVAIPWTDLGMRPEAGKVLGFEIWRTSPSAEQPKGRWSYMPKWWGAQDTSQFGHLILD